MIENDKVIRERVGGENVYSLLQHCNQGTDFLSELFLSQSKNVNGTELESF